MSFPCGSHCRGARGTMKSPRARPSRRPSPTPPDHPPRPMLDDRRREVDRETGVRPLLESRRHWSEQHQHAEKLGACEFHAEVRGKAKVRECLRHLRQAQLRIRGEGDLQAEDRGYAPVSGRRGFGGLRRGDGRHLHGRFNNCCSYSSLNCFAYSSFNRCQPSNFMASGPAMRAIGFPPSSRSRTSRLICHPAAPHDT